MLQTKVPHGGYATTVVMPVSPGFGAETFEEVIEDDSPELAKLQEEQLASPLLTFPIDNVEFLQGSQPTSTEAYEYEYEPMTGLFVGVTPIKKYAYMSTKDFLRKFFPSIAEERTVCVPKMQQAPNPQGGKLLVHPPPEGTVLSNVIVVDDDGTVFQMEFGMPLSLDAIREEINHMITTKYTHELMDKYGKIPKFQVLVYDPTSLIGESPIPIASADHYPLTEGNTLGSLLVRKFGSDKKNYLIPVVLKPVRTMIRRTAAGGNQSRYLSDVVLSQQDPAQARLILKKRLQDISNRKKQLQQLIKYHGRAKDEFEEEFEREVEEREKKRKKRRRESIPPPTIPEEQQYLTTVREMLFQLVDVLYRAYIEGKVDIQDEHYSLDSLINTLLFGTGEYGVDFMKEYYQMQESILNQGGSDLRQRTNFFLALEEVIGEAQKMEWLIAAQPTSKPLFDEFGNVIALELENEGITPIRITPSSNIHIHASNEFVQVPTIQCEHCHRWRPFDPSLLPEQYEVRRQDGVVDCDTFGFVFKYDDNYATEFVPLNSSFIRSSSATRFENMIHSNLLQSFGVVVPYEDGFEVEFVSGESGFLSMGSTEVFSLNGMKSIGLDGTVLVTDGKGNVMNLNYVGKATHFYCKDGRGNTEVMDLSEVLDVRERTWQCGDVGMISRDRRVMLWISELRGLENRLNQNISLVEKRNILQDIERIRSSLHKVEQQSAESMEALGMKFASKEDEKWNDMIREIDLNARDYWKELKSLEYIEDEDDIVEYLTEEDLDNIEEQMAMRGELTEEDRAMTKERKQAPAAQIRFLLEKEIIDDMKKKKGSDEPLTEEEMAEVARLVDNRIKNTVSSRTGEENILHRSWRGCNEEVDLILQAIETLESRTTKPG